MDPFVFRALRPSEHLGLWPGDEIVVEPGHPSPIVLTRLLPPNYGAILAAAASGGLELVTRNQPLEALVAIAGASSPPSSLPQGHAPGRHGLGWRVRRARFEVLR